MWSSYWHSQSISDPPQHEVIGVRRPTIPGESGEEPETAPPSWFPRDAGSTTIFFKPTTPYCFDKSWNKQQYNFIVETSSTDRWIAILMSRYNDVTSGNHPNPEAKPERNPTGNIHNFESGERYHPNGRERECVYLQPSCQSMIEQKPNKGNCKEVLHVQHEH